MSFSFYFGDVLLEIIGMNYVLVMSGNHEDES